MTKLTEPELAAWERGRDLNAELREALEQARRGEWVRKTEFLPQPDGALRRLVTRRDGTVEKDERIAPAQSITRAVAGGVRPFAGCLSTHRAGVGTGSQDPDRSGG